VTVLLICQVKNPSLVNSPSLSKKFRLSVEQTPLIKPKFHYADFATRHKSCKSALSWFVSTTVADFPVHCNGLNKATQMGLSRTCHGLCRKYLAMPRQFLFATFMFYVRDFHFLCAQLSLRGSFGESRRNGIWA